jgi:hypothetical protein
MQTKSQKLNHDISNHDIAIVPTGDLSKAAKLKMLMDDHNIHVISILSYNPEDVQVAIEAGFVQNTETNEIWVRA